MDNLHSPAWLPSSLGNELGLPSFSLESPECNVQFTCTDNVFIPDQPLSPWPDTQLYKCDLFIYNFKMPSDTRQHRVLQPRQNSPAELPAMD